MTDEQGRFELKNVPPEKTFILVQHPGFRFQGWPVDPAAQAGELSLTLVRSSETPDRKMTPLAEPLPLDESRALAYRVLEPRLKEGRAQPESNDAIAAIRAMSTFDLDRASNGIYSRTASYGGPAILRLTSCRPCAGAGEKGPGGG